MNSTQNTDRLSPAAVAEITATFNSMTLTTLTVEEYVRRHFADGAWGGDTCGCVDDRCIGYHHDAGERCGCLDVFLDELHDELCDAYNARKAVEGR